MRYKHQQNENESDRFLRLINLRKKCKKQREIIIKITAYVPTIFKIEFIDFQITHINEVVVFSIYIYIYNYYYNYN